MTSFVISSILRSLSFAATVVVAVVLVRSLSGFIYPIPFQVDEAQYLGWSHQLAAGYFSKPPLIAWMLAFNSSACHVFGIDAIEGCARMSQSFALGGAALFAGLAAWALFQDRSVAIASTLLLLASPLFGFYSLFATTDAWLLLCWSASLWFFVIATRSGNSHTSAWIACGIAVGLGLLAKYSMGIFVLSALIWLLLQRRLFTLGPWMAVLAAFLVFLPNLIWNVQTGFPTFVHHVEISQVENLGASRWSIGAAGLSTLEFLLAQFLIIGPFALGAAIFIRPGLQLSWRLHPLSPVLLLLVFALPMLGIIVLQSFISRAHANWAAPAYVALAIYVAWLWFGQRREATNPGVGWLLFVASIGFGLLMSVVLTALPKVAFYASNTVSIRAVEKLRGWKEVAQWANRYAIQHNVTLLARDRSLLAAIHAYRENQRTKVYAFDPSGQRRHHYTWFQNIADASELRGPILLIDFAEPSPQWLQQTGLVMVRQIEDPLLSAIDIGDRKAKMLSYELARQPAP